MSDVERISNVELEFGGQSYFDFADETHFWIHNRFAVLTDMLKRNRIDLTPETIGFEIGCGNGIVRYQLEKRYGCTVHGSDLDINGLNKNKPCRGKAYLYDILECRPEFAGRFDFIGLFDVIEHIEDVDSFLKASMFHVKPGGYVFVNVPAMPSLFSAYDSVQGHCRRYTPALLDRHLQQAGLEVVDRQYWGVTMIPVVALRKLLLSISPKRENVHDAGFQPPTPLVHRILYGLMRFERGAMPRPGLGTSLMAIGRKAP